MNTVLSLLPALLCVAPAPPANPTPLVGDWAQERVRCRPLSLRQVSVRGFLGERIDQFRNIQPAGHEMEVFFQRQETVDCLCLGDDIEVSPACNQEGAMGKKLYMPSEFTYSTA